MTKTDSLKSGKSPYSSCQTEVKEQSAEEDGQTEEDGGKKLTPTLQRSVSEESAISVASVGVEAKTRLESETDAESVVGEGLELEQLRRALTCIIMFPVVKD